MTARTYVRSARCSLAIRAFVALIILPLAMRGTAAAQAMSLSDEEAAARAVEHAPAAQALEREAYALCCELDSHDAAARQQVGLMQRVLMHLAAHQRNEAAGETLADYFRIVGLQHQLQLTQQADEVLLRLKNAAEIARQLNIAQNGTAPEDVMRQRLQLDDRRAELAGAIDALKISLARQVGADLAASDQIELSGELVVEYRERDPAQAVDLALRRRQDLQAIAVVCSCLNSQTTPAARTMLGVVQPGLGLTAASAEPGLLPMLRRGSAEDARCRRGQCSQLQESRRRDVEAETRAAVVQLHTAYRRLALADEIVQSYQDQVEGLRGAIEATETPSPELDRLTLALLEAQGTYYLRLTEARLAEVELQQTQGVLYPATP